MSESFSLDVARIWNNCNVYKTIYILDPPSGCVATFLQFTDELETISIWRIAKERRKVFLLIDIPYTGTHIPISSSISLGFEVVPISINLYVISFSS